jgi:ubiquinone/menaquinone biosynthesis C-methylase UbiE
MQRTDPVTGKAQHGWVLTIRRLAGDQYKEHKMASDDPESASKNWWDVTVFDDVYRTRPGETYLQCFRYAYGDDFPEEAEPHSFTTQTDLRRAAQCLAIGSGSILVDMGCGRGGPGLWLARQTGADLIGIDLSSTAIQQANQLTTRFNLAGRARFLQGDLCSTGLTDQCCEAAISFDVMMFIPDIQAVMQEVTRILKPGARFVFTSFEGEPYDFYRAPLLDHGFGIEVYEEKPDWKRRQLMLYAKTIEEQAELIREIGEGARPLIEEAEYFLANGLENTRHVFVVVRKSSLENGH